MREPIGRFYVLAGVEAAIPNPYTVPPQDPNPPNAIIDTYSVQVPGDFFFTTPGAYAGDVTGGPFAASALGDAALGNLTGEFEYTLMNASFAGVPSVLDPFNAGVVTPIAFGNLTAGSGTVHELAVACTFKTLP
jgi:hypothetical protein